MVQLDLFGGLFQEPAKPEKKQVEPKKSTVVEQPQPKAEEMAKPAADVVFNDGKIGVKIKVKEQVAPAIKEEVVVKDVVPVVEVPMVEKVAPAVNVSTIAKPKKVKRPPQKRGRKSFKEIDAELDLVQVPDDEILFQKQYYSITIVAKWFRLNTSLLRAWDNEFDILKPRKNRKGDRLFRPEDVKNIQLIYQLLRHKKYTVEGAKEYIKAHKKQADVQLHLGQTLQKFKSFLLEMKATLEV